MPDVPTILLVEDDEGHAVLLQSSLLKAGFRNPVIRCHDGQEALDFLFGDSFRRQVRNGSLTVLLDIRLPKVDGIEVLRRVREQRAFDAIPVIMVTTTDDPKEMERCRTLGATAHLAKSVNRGQFASGLAALARCFAPRPPATD